MSDSLANTYLKFKVDNIGYAIANELCDAIHKSEEKIIYIDSYKDTGGISSLIIVGGHELHNVIIFDNLMNSERIKVPQFISAPDTLHCYKKELIGEQIEVYHNLLKLSTSEVNVININRYFSDITISFISPSSKESDDYFLSSENDFLLNNIDENSIKIYFWPIGELEPNANYFELRIPQEQCNIFLSKAEIFANGSYGSGFSEDILKEILITSVSNSKNINWVETILSSVNNLKKIVFTKNKISSLKGYTLNKNLNSYVKKIVCFFSSNQIQSDLAIGHRNLISPTFTLITDENKLAVISSRSIDAKTFLIRAKEVVLSKIEREIPYTILEDFDENTSYSLIEENGILVLIEE